MQIIVVMRAGVEFFENCECNDAGCWQLNEPLWNVELFHYTMIPNLQACHNILHIF